MLKFPRKEERKNERKEGEKKGKKGGNKGMGKKEEENSKRMIWGGLLGKEKKVCKK